MKIEIIAVDREDLISYIENVVIRELREGYKSGIIDADNNWDVVE